LSCGNIRPGQTAIITWTVSGTLEPVRLRRKNLGDKNVPDSPPLMVSEDFPRFSLGDTIPSVTFHLGAADPAKLASGAIIAGLHSSGFTPVPEPTIRGGIKA
jgi:hippurate hydrolase